MSDQELMICRRDLEEWAGAFASFADYVVSHRRFTVCLDDPEKKRSTLVAFFMCERIEGRTWWRDCSFSVCIKGDCVEVTDRASGFLVVCVGVIVGFDPAPPKVVED